MAEIRTAKEPAYLLSAPPPTLPLGFFVPGILALVAAFAALPFLAPKLDWYLRQEVLAAVHTVTLGFVLAIFLGASVQLLPVLAGETLKGTLAVRLANLFVVAGAAGMVAHFWKLRWPGILISATSVALGVAIFTAATASVLLRGRSDAVRLGLLLSYLGLALTIGAGLLIGCDRHRQFLPGAPLDHLAAHLHLGLLATFGTAIFAVETKLLPMFLLAPQPEPRRVKATLALLFGGALLLALALWFHLPAAPFALLPAAGLALQLHVLRGILKQRKRRAIDVGFVYALSAYADLAAALVVGLLWVSGLGSGTLLAVRLPFVYVFLLLVGFVVQTVVGILSKILPFLVWQAVYAKRVGLARVPSLAELSSERLQRAGFWLFRAATVLTAIALWRGRVEEIRIATAFLAFSILPFVLHAGRVLLHLRRAREAAPSPAAVGRMALASRA